MESELAVEALGDDGVTDVVRESSGPSILIKGV